MADNLTTTTSLSSVPSGTVFSTDDAGAAGHVPVGKLAISTDGSATLIPADATNGLDVDVTRVQGTVAVTQSGAWTVAATQSGTWDEVGINDSGNSITVDNGGTFATQIDGAALTALQLIDNVVAVEDAAAVGGESGVPILAVRRDAASSGVSADGDFANLSVDSTGALRVVGSSATTQYAEDAAHTTGDSVVFVGAIRRDTTPASSSGTAGDYSAINVDANGRLYVQAVLYNSSGTELTADTQGTQDTALGTITSVTGSMPLLRASAAAPTGVSADDDAVLPWALRNGSQVVNTAVGGTLVAAGAGLPVHTSPQTTDGLSTAMFSGSDGSSILVATAQVIKASAGLLYGYYFYNPEAAVTFVHFYNTAAASVTVGTTSPLFTLPLPAGAAAHVSIPHGVTFSNAGWSCAATTTAGGNTAPATGVSLVCWYK